MATPGYESLSVLKITRIMQALEDVRELPQELKFVGRTPFVPAADNEIVGRWINRVQIADLISDDARALTYSAGKLQTETTVVPNIKHGRRLTQENLNQLQAINANPTWPPGDVSGLNNEVFGNVLPSIVDDLRTGIYQRCEALLVAMHLDSMSYNRFGMQIAGSWGTPADLKVSPVYPWTDPVNATPVNDLWTLKRNASVRYGANYDRVTMSTTAFIYMISTAEFQAKARTTLPLFINYGNLPQANLALQRDVAANIIGCDLELYDARYWSQDEGGHLSSAPYLPINRVLLTEKANDNNPQVQDFANGVTTESLLSGLLPNAGASGVIGAFDKGMRGPIAYSSVDPALNPPTLTLWAVMRGFPRRYKVQASAVLNIGNFTDQIAISDPF